MVAFLMPGIISYMQTKGYDVTHMMSRLHMLCRRFRQLYGTHPHDICQQTTWMPLQLLVKQ
jgi:hypothetical protein